MNSQLFGMYIFDIPGWHGKNAEPSLLLLKDDGRLRGKHLATPGAVSRTSHCFPGIALLLERTTLLDKLVIQTWKFSRYVTKMNEASPSHQGRSLAVFVANDKIWASEQKLEFWNAYICCSELNSLPSDDRGGGSNNCGFFEVVWWNT